MIIWRRVDDFGGWSALYERRRASLYLHNWSRAGARSRLSAAPKEFRPRARSQSVFDFKYDGGKKMGGKGGDATISP